MIWLLTCEHYANGIPLKYAPLFVNAVDVLESHRGYDVRVAPLFIRLETLFDQSHFYRYSRLLIEPNRSLHHNHLFSPFTAALSRTEKNELIGRYYQPYRNQIEAFIKSYIKQGVFHVSLHTFTPRLGNQNRDSEIGILFDPKRQGEKDLALLLKQKIKETNAQVKVRYNYPYRGTADGFTTYLRKVFPENYIGFELEVRNDVALELRGDLYTAFANLRGILN